MDGLTWTRNDVITGFDGAMSVYASDFNQDGYVDIAGTNYGESIIKCWFNNTVTGTTANVESFGSFLAPSSKTIYADDMDIDGGH